MNGNGGNDVARREALAEAGFQQVESLYYSEKAAAEQAETERIKAETELEKTKTEYLVEQMKGVPLPAPEIEIPAIETGEIAGFSPLLFVGLFLLYDYFKRGKK